MATENAKIDNNREKTLLGVTDDSAAEIRRLLVDATTGRLKVSAVISGATSLSTKGDLLGYTTEEVRIPVGTDGQVLQADSTQAAGVKWAAAGGDVTAASNLGDNFLIRGDGAGKGIQNSGISVDDSDNVTNVANISATGATLSGLTASEILATDGSKNLVSLAVATYPSLTELSYVKGVSSAIQTQLEAKGDALTSDGLDQFASTTSAELAGVISDETGSGALVFGTSPTFLTSITGDYLTASEILITDGFKNIVSAPVATYPSLTELSYVKGVTSAIQTQLGNKLENISEDTTPELGGELDAGAHSIGFTEGSATGDGTTTINWTAGNKFKFTFGAQNETFTFTAPSNPCNLVLVMIQDGTGSRTATWPATVKWPGGTAPTLSTAASSIDIISFYYDGTSYYGVASLDFS